MFSRNLNRVFFVYYLLLFVYVISFPNLYHENLPIWMSVLAIVAFVLITGNFVWGEISIKKNKEKLMMFLNENGYLRKVNTNTVAQTPDFEVGNKKKDLYFIFVIDYLPKFFSRNSGKKVEISSRCTVYAMEQYCVVESHDDDSLSLYKKS